MKIAVSAMEPTLDSEIDPRFGRSRHFILADPETMEFEAIDNPNLEASSGAGISTAQLICDRGAKAVITGRIGPKADQVLSAAGVQMVTGVSGKVADALKRFKAGDFAKDAYAGAASSSRRGPQQGRGMGTGAGRGMGGGGRGMKGGRLGGCGGRGMGMRQGGSAGGAPVFRNWDTEPWSARGAGQSDQDELAWLKQRADMLADELSRIRQRIDQIQEK
ncbi:NifB/NifX family molybdenum-iron cluster-binding protein [Desulfoferrobacter suflitae]|uniref:NifB/NifX family molybdenum-iron cluster-binding protein n=1 Tax=Desulfoferrobacter suflitae TaxID=2865782 RepID=UPI002164DECE|nr:NifB/NifX family molybdenum-iron cluster-binding protein [Desulfoferrobacter suflitae]MCK8603601.1 NifB/NifX family molybdenum-iron cluster-binding protein [Desulfoferrobacter suflitae]